jgi:hypothetical protein
VFSRHVYQIYQFSIIMEKDLQNDPVFRELLEVLSCHATEKRMFDDAQLEELKIELRSSYTSPPLTRLRDILGQNITIEEARELFFFPKIWHIRIYPKLLRASAAIGGDRTMDLLLLSMFSLKHLYDLELMRTFARFDGLLILTKLLLDEDKNVSGNALYPFTIYRMMTMKWLKSMIIIS